jgi:negative regulator of replication initiation
MNEKIEPNLNNEGKNSRRAFYIRLSEDEYNRIQTMVETIGITAPEIFRRALLDTINFVQPLFSKQDTQQIMTELSRQGNNINQIAKRVNSGLLTGWDQSFNNMVRAYMDLRHLIASSYGSR